MEHVHSSNNKISSYTSKILQAPEHSAVVLEKQTALHTI